MLTLAIDTSSKTASVALLAERCVLSESSIFVTSNQDAVLVSLIDGVLSLCAAKIRDIDLLALTIGPGSFTGLRIGASTVKGLALATGKPVTGVSTLEALASNVIGSRLRVCPFMDARRGEVYTALYGNGETGRLSRLTDEMVVKPELFLTGLEGDVLFLGDGVEPYMRFIKGATAVKPFFAPHHLQMVKASAVGMIALELYKEGQTVDLFSFTPRYLRLSQAEARLKG